ncbi:MAG TPA: heavy metal translocating P-type ATPase, partial [Candidatus Dormibacteraeota bacterium]|nr:heavy metal translocating P-type ATPase [Candidatus Dormibacteraeota bacterium]
AGALDGIAPDLEQLLRYVSALVATPVVLYAAQPFFLAAWQSLRSGMLGMDVPVALSIGAAYLWSLWVTLSGTGAVYFDSAVMFTFLLLLGRYVEMSLRHRAASRHDSLGELLPRSVQRLRAGRTEQVTPEELVADDRIRILAGERVPADGVIVVGTSEVDESLLSGESAPRLCRPGDTLCTGTLNLNGVLEMMVTRAGQDSTLAAVARLLERARTIRPAVADLADRVAGWFVAAILVLSLAVGLYWWHSDPGRAFPAVLAVLVVTCPCALSLATPAALAAATARLAGAGVLVTRSRALERLAHVERCVFDKTGTLTRGEPRIEDVEIFDAATTRQQALALAAALEAYTRHPLARAFAGCEPLPGLHTVQVAPGQGIEGALAERRFRIGQLAYVSWDRGATAPPGRAARDDQTCVYLADEHKLLARFTLSDTLRHDALATIERMAQLGIAAQIASGDRAAVVSTWARRLHIETAQGQLSGADKLAVLRALQQSEHRVLMVGDGINDAPVLAAADVSAALGTGTDLAQVSADLVLMGDGLGGLVEAVATSRRMLRVIRENLLWAVAYNIVAVPLAASGRLQPWIAAVGMSVSSLLVVVNALRLLPAAAPAARSAPHPITEVLGT